MKAFAAIVCLVATIVVNGAPPSIEEEPMVDCNVSVGEDDWAILLPNPVDCGSYYVCDFGRAIRMPCPKGLHFNSVLSVCDWPRDANCTAATGYGEI